MDANRFYLFGTRETVYMKDVCGRIEREDQEAGVGLFHHFAGFFDPYWGGGITLEMLTTMYKNRILTHGQSVGRVYFEDLSSPVMRQYGEKAGSHYKDQQAPRLAKFFKNFQTPVS
jgi:dCTP deaminase